MSGCLLKKRLCLRSDRTATGSIVESQPTTLRRYEMPQEPLLIHTCELVLLFSFEQLSHPFHVLCNHQRVVRYKAYRGGRQEVLRESKQGGTNTGVHLYIAPGRIPRPGSIYTALVPLYCLYDYEIELIPGSIVLYSEAPLPAVQPARLVATAGYGFPRGMQR